MHQATSRCGVLVVLKTIIGYERQLLHYLSGIRPTIPSHLSIEKVIIVLPWKSPLDKALQFGDRPDDVVSLCLQFIEGVAFCIGTTLRTVTSNPIMWSLIQNPSRNTPRIFIDFCLALSVESEETMTEGWCGTPPWIAPELGSRNGPIQTAQSWPIGGLAAG